VSEVSVAALHVYPIKSARGLPSSSVRVAHFGFDDDRSWLLVDGSGGMVTQRQVPGLARLRLERVGGRLLLHHEGQAPLRVKPRYSADRVTARVWGREVVGIDQGEDPARWLSEALGCPVRLLAFESGPGSVGDPDATMFADGYPVLVASEASLDDLNRRLLEAGSQAIPMDRFRPNLVLRGLQPWDEDRIASLRIGEVELQLAKPCARCVITTTDQQTARRAPDGEPLRTLATFRKGAEGVEFGWNATITAGRSAFVSVGDPVQPSWRSTGPREA